MRTILKGRYVRKVRTSALRSELTHWAKQAEDTIGQFLVIPE